MKRYIFIILAIFASQVLSAQTVAEVKANYERQKNELQNQIRQYEIQGQNARQAMAEIQAREGEFGYVTPEYERQLSLSIEAKAMIVQLNKRLQELNDGLSANLQAAKQREDDQRKLQQKQQKQQKQQSQKKQPQAQQKPKGPSPEEVARQKQKEEEDKAKKEEEMLQEKQRREQQEAQRQEVKNRTAAEYMEKTEAATRNKIDRNNFRSARMGEVYNRTQTQAPSHFNSSVNVPRTSPPSPTSKGNPSLSALLNKVDPLQLESYLLDDSSIQALSSIMDKDFASVPSVEEWPYDSRYPITMVDSETSFPIVKDDSYEKMLESYSKQNKKVYSTWKELKKDPYLSEDMLNLIRGSMMQANGGIIPKLVKTYENGAIEFGDSTNMFIISADRTRFIHLKSEEHNISEDNIINNLSKGKTSKIGSLDAKANLPLGVEYSLAKGENSKKESFPPPKLSEDKSKDKSKDKPEDKSEEKIKLGGISAEGKLNIIDHSGKYTIANYEIKNDHVIGIELKLTGGVKVDAKLDAKAVLASFTESGTSFDPDLSLGARAGVDAISIETRYITNTMVQNSEGYSVIRSRQLGGAVGFGMNFKLKATKDQAEFGAGLLSVKAIYSCEKIKVPRL